MLNRSKSIFVAILTFFSQAAFSQTKFDINSNQLDGRIQQDINDIENGIRPVQSAVPFLNISPNARASGMGDQGVATSPDEYSTFWNPGKLAMIQKDFGVGICYNPWLRKLVNDMSLSYLSGYYRLRKEDVIGASLTYFNLGSITFTDQNAQTLFDYNPREFAAALSYSRLLGRGFSAGVSIKYIYSNLAGDIIQGGSQSKPAQTPAADLGFYYNKDLVIADRDFNLALGTSITNIGGKVSYSTTSRQDFIPTMFRLGTVGTYELDDFNKFSLGIEASKLLVPSSVIEPVIVKTPDGRDSIARVRLVTPNKSLLGGMFGSFGDAPFGAKEELQEIMLSFGAEYWYDDLFAVRAGYFYENPHKGNRKYLTVGLGLRYQIFGLDFSYLVATDRTNPLAETLRFALSFNFEKTNKSTQSVVE